MLCLAAGADEAASAAVSRLPLDLRLAEGIAAEGAARVFIVDRGMPGLVTVEFGAADGPEGHVTQRLELPELRIPVDAASHDGHRFVLDRARKDVLVVDPGGATRWLLGARSDELSDPIALDIAPDGDLRILDAGSATILRVAADGTIVGRVGRQGQGALGMSCPHDLVTAPDGTTFVADAGNRRIQRYAADGTCLGPWGAYGEGPDHFRDPTGVALAPDGNLIVADHYGHRLEVYDVVTGREIVARRVELAPRIRYPARLVVLADGRCVVTSPQLHEVWVMPCP